VDRYGDVRRLYPFLANSFRIWFTGGILVTLLRFGVLAYFMVT